ncbi:hypothetical protein TNCT_21731 [Trichonephila clavata]|uniref:Uncharacterized protein n=1 Tax=Trichonephila clavata TaxID=2740835 RepID=A0A8X6H578_TRICU|nr:hypothetical protein TNCT_21731 [Trichonephila clavata]
MAVWTTILVTSVIAWTPSTVLTALHFIGCLDYKFSHISGCQDTIKSTYSAALHWLFGLLVYLNQPLSGHIKLRIALPFSGCLDYKFSQISCCLEGGHQLFLQRCTSEAV